MANNILLNKPATASSFVMPYASSKIVDGAITPFNRWMCNAFPGWITIDAGAAFWVNRWVVKLMGNAGWASNYNMAAYTLQVSTDNIAWTTIDAVAANTANTTDRTFATVSARYFRVSVPSGIAINSKLASIMEFEVYDAPAPDGLSSLTISSGTLTPAFSNSVFNYNASIDYDVASITLTPTASSTSATITVDGTAVTSGTASQAISLNVGETKTIPVVVTTNGTAKTYNVVLKRQTSAYLTNLQVKKGLSNLAFTPPFARTTLGPYALSVPATTTSATIVVSKEDSNATVVVTCNTTVLTASGTSYPLSMPTAGAYAIVVKVTSTSGDVKNYTLNITRS